MPNHPIFDEILAKYDRVLSDSDYVLEKHDIEWLIDHVKYLTDENATLSVQASVSSELGTELFTAKSDIEKLKDEVKDFRQSYEVRLKEIADYRAKNIDLSNDIETLENEVRMRQDSLDYYKEAFLRRINDLFFITRLVFNRCANNYASETAEMIALIKDAVEEIQADYEPNHIPF